MSDRVESGYSSMTASLGRGVEGERVNKSVVDYFRCLERLPELRLESAVAGSRGFFRVGRDALAYGTVSSRHQARSLSEDPEDLLPYIEGDSDILRMPFDLTEAIDNLRHERYVTAVCGNHGNSILQRGIRKAYYTSRPLLPVCVRRHLQRRALRNWRNLKFPTWPVDASVDLVLKRVLGALMRAAGVERWPFIWFWPDGYRAAVMLTHDVETAAGRDFCRELMKIDQAHGFLASFQFVPEKRYDCPASLRKEISDAGFEVCVQGLNHDGYLFSSHPEFLRRVKAINRYAVEYGAEGFRSPVLYRNLDWYSAFEFAYDMSVPNVAHLDPQRGGCCTVMPYFVGDILELPVTTTQDYSLFHIIGSDSLDLWNEQIDAIVDHNGLVSFIIHPDYVLVERFRRVFERLLERVSAVCAERNLWRALPRDINRWWRQRSEMELSGDGGRLTVRGTGAERASIAYAVLNGDDVLFEMGSE